MALPSPGERTSSPTVTLGFYDAKGCRRWLSKLPLANLPIAQEALTEQFARLQKTELPPLERAKMAEMLRDTVHFLHTKLSRRYAQKALPLDAPEEEAWQQERALWQGLWQQYSACLAPIIEGDPEIAPWGAHVLQRGLSVGQFLVLMHALARRTPPPELWLELHAYYRFSEMRECADTAIKDKLQTNVSATSCYATYAHALLLELADLGALTTRQIELTDRWLERWGRKLFFRGQVEPAPFYHAVDFKQGSGISTLKALPQSRPDSLRVAVSDKLELSITERLKRLESGTSPAELNLGSDCSVETCASLLKHLRRCWCTANSQEAIDAAEHDVWICDGGLSGAYFRIGGMSFGTGGSGDKLSFAGTQMYATLNFVTGYDPLREQAERAFRWDEWRAVLTHEETLRRSALQGGARWGMEQLATFRDSTEAMRCAYVRWLRQDVNNELLLKLHHWDGEPRAMVLNPLGHLLKDERPFPAILLPVMGNEPATFLVPPRTFIAGRHVETKPPATPMKARFTRLIQRGADFERVVFLTE